MRHTTEFSAFPWARGRPNLWRISVDRQGRRDALLVYEEVWPNPWDNQYEPLKQEPHLYVEFAELGRRALEGGRRRYAEYLRETKDTDSPPTDRELLLWAEG